MSSGLLSSANSLNPKCLSLKPLGFNGVGFLWDMWLSPNIQPPALQALRATIHLFLYLHIVSHYFAFMFKLVTLNLCFFDVCSWLRPVVVFWSRGLFFFGSYHWIKVKGQRASAEAAPILAVAPHSSYIDALVVVYLNLTSIVAKNSAIQIPFFGSKMFMPHTISCSCLIDSK